MLDAAVACDVGRFVFASSCNVYGRAAAEELSEESAADPINPYAASKLDAETLVAEASAQSSMSATSLRMSTVFGTAPGMRFNLVVNQFVFRAVTGRRLTVYGDGTNWRPFVHVEDAARAYREAALAPSDWPAAVYNVGDGGQNLQIDEVAATVRDLVGPVDLRYLEQEDPGPSYHVNFDRLGETGYQTEHSVSGGIEDLAAQLRGSESLEPSR